MSERSESRAARTARLRATGLYSSKEISARRDWSNARVTRSIAAKRNRLQTFTYWSQKNVGFPRKQQKEIDTINDNAGYEDKNSYGYRMFYRRYVLKMDDDEAFTAMDEGRGSP